MIYEYPEEFIIPIIYVNDLKVKSSYRHEDFESSRNLKLLILDEELQGDKILQDNMNIGTLDEISDMNFLDMDEDLLIEPYQKAMFIDNVVEENLEDENVKSILSDIDNEYANSETPCVCSKH